MVEKLCVIQSDERDHLVIETGIQQLIDALSTLDRAQLLESIHLLVPECVDPLRSKILVSIPASLTSAAKSVIHIDLERTVP
jgi:hypothetical protein